MSSNANTPLPKQPRRTWRQWSKLTRVRIGFVLMLIVAICLFLLWLPRRGMVAVAREGGMAVDHRAAIRVEQTLTKLLPFPIFNKLWPRIWRYTHWLSEDSRIGIIDFGRSKADRISFSKLHRFPTMYNLGLRGRDLTQHLSELPKLEQLTSVTIYGLGAENDLGELRRVAGINELNILSTPEEGGGLEDLKFLTSLRRITFSQPPSRAALHGVGQMEFVEFVDLYEGVSNEDDLRCLSGMNSLRDLRIEGSTPIGPQGLKRLSEITTLETLRIGGTSVTDDELQVLTALSQLKSLRVAGANLTKAGIDRLQEAIPNIRIDSR